MVRFAMPAPEEEKPPTETNTSSLSITSSGDCLKCHKNKISYECDPCGCPSYCTDCARKLASGGKCKICKQFFGGLRRIRVS